jgi:hypothetical protein
MQRLSTAIAGVLVGVPLILLSPPARADDSSLVNEAKALGFQQASDNLISTARSACYFLSRGRDPGHVTDRISRYLAVDADLAGRFFAMSVNEYCPQYRDRIGG